MTTAQRILTSVSGTSSVRNYGPAQKSAGSALVSDQNQRSHTPHLSYAPTAMALVGSRTVESNHSRRQVGRPDEHQAPLAQPCEYLSSYDRLFANTMDCYLGSAKRSSQNTIPRPNRVRQRKRQALINAQVYHSLIAYWASGSTM